MKTSNRIASLRDRLDLHIFLGYNNEPEKVWSIHLDYKWDEVKIEQAIADIKEALQTIIEELDMALPVDKSDDI